MATPTTNFVPVSGVDPLATGEGVYLVWGEKWGGGVGSGVTLTYSFPVGTASFETGYSEWNSWGQLSLVERTAVRDGLAVWSDSADVDFVQIADNSKTVGELRFAYTDGASGENAHAYYPSGRPSAGDVWFNRSSFNLDGDTNVQPGSYDYLTILHEIGHALGLKHSFQGPYPIPAELDSSLYSIMSYTASPWSSVEDNYATFHPTTPMYYDLLAIEALYGENSNVNAGNDVYAFNDGTRYWQAINDAGGQDIIVYNGVENSTINLNPGRFSAISERIYFNGGSTRATVTIGPGVVIEAARGGSGSDVLIGNAVANVLNGALGADHMQAGAGNDIYVVDNAGDVVDETRPGSSGIDTVQSSISFDLANTSSVLGSVENLALLGTGAISGRGNALGNVITGNAGSNVLNGAFGADTMRGLAGNDVYIVENVGDVVNESPAGSAGIDTVQSAVSFSLVNSARVQGAVERLTLLAAGNINGTGNILNNLITGNAGDNVLTGGAGADTMRGLAGNDVYVVDNAGDVVNEGLAGSSGIDTVQSSISFDLANPTSVLGSVEALALLGTGDINGTGNALNNLITGNAGSNVLDGGVGADAMRGLAGNDVYVVDNSGDVVDESRASSSGIDTVLSSISFNLANPVSVLGSVEDLTLLGTGAISGRGNALSNVITGNAGSNVLNGAFGADTMRGLAGNDVYIVDNARDVVNESLAESGGIDTVQSAVSFSLVNSARVQGAIEYLTLLGAGNINGTGNIIGNVITGSAGDNVLNGGLGSDVLTGGAGHDVFVLSSAPNAVSNVDRITDFNALEDTIALGGAVMPALGGTLALGSFWMSDTGLAHDGDDRIIYDPVSGWLNYDSNGNAVGGSVHLATLTANLALDSGDFLVA